MTDPVSGLALACIAIIEPLIHLGHGIHNSARRALQFGKDAESLRVSFNHERRRLEAIRKVLLEKEFGPEKPLTLFEQFRDDWQADLFDELRQLRVLYLELESMEERYQIFAPPHTSLAMNRPTDAMVDLSLRDRRETKLQDAATRKQLAFWALRDSKRTESLLMRLAQWVNRFREAVAMYLWAYFSDRQQLQQIENDSDARALDLASAARLRQIILANVEEGSKLAINPSDVSQQRKLGHLSGRLYAAQFKHMDVLIEHKEYDLDAAPEVSNHTTDRVCQLAALLHHQSSRSLRVLQCQGYFVDAAHARYNFIYKIPDDVENSPISLLNAMAERDAFKSTVKHRIQMAHTLAVTLHQLHLVGWVHKSLRSENVILFPQAPGETSPQSAYGDSMAERITKREFIVPWVVGFEYSRVVSGDSDLTEDDGIQRNVYRHPERWNSPTHRFAKIHDIYALGTILLEISLWRPLLKLSGTGFSRAIGADNSAAGQAKKESVKSQLLQNAEKVPYTLGQTFRDGVVACLKGNSMDGFGVEPLDDQGLQKAFHSKVVEPLGRVLTSI